MSTGNAGNAFSFLKKSKGLRFHQGVGDNLEILEVKAGVDAGILDWNKTFHDAMDSTSFLPVKSISELSQTVDSGNVDGRGGTPEMVGENHQEMKKDYEYKRKRCEHGRTLYACKFCKGAGICKHGREKRYCKECSGASLCPHKRRKSTCKQCGGASICHHQRRRSDCKDCKGGGLCKHNYQRNKCKECNISNGLGEQYGTLHDDAQNAFKTTLKNHSQASAFEVFKAVRQKNETGNGDAKVQETQSKEQKEEYTVLEFNDQGLLVEKSAT